jgi:hypothetical protein
LLITTTFPLGAIVATSNALDVLTQLDVPDGLTRHAAKDWGDLDPEDWRSNDHAVDHGGRILSAYASANGTKFWLTTEHDRSATTILLPEDY